MKMNKYSKYIIGCIIIASLLIYGCISDSIDGTDNTEISVIGETKDTLEISDVNNIAASLDNPKYGLSSYYSLEGFTVNLAAPEYNLPINIGSIKNYNDIDNEFHLDNKQLTKLKNNGFVIIDYGYVEDIAEPYRDLNDDVPIFITSDTLLHLYHIQFDDILQSIEKREFFDLLLDMSLALQKDSIALYDEYKNSNQSNYLTEAVRRNIAYFSVALSLLQTSTEGYNETYEQQEIEKWNYENPWDEKKFTPVRRIDYSVPDDVKDDVDAELVLIKAHQGLDISNIFNYQEDYSQYVPRGHYTDSELLKRYFKAMMWYGRISFLIKGGEDGDFIISEENSLISTLQASIISKRLSEITISDNNFYADEAWEKIYKITSFFVGKADDPTPYEYMECLIELFGTYESIDFIELAENNETFFNFKSLLAQLRNPKIYGGTGNIEITPPYTENNLNVVLDSTKGMRLMGQRYVPDSYMFQNLVFPKIGAYIGNDDPFTSEPIILGSLNRCFPRGLDVMAVLGSERAFEILSEEGDTDYENYIQQLDLMRTEFSVLDITDWNRNLYWSWLYSLRPLLKKYGEGYPIFMQTKAWQDKQLQTALGSWTELRHDTILYAKQSYTPLVTAWFPEPEKEPELRGYIEPVPEFYSRTLALTNMTLKGLSALEVLSEQEENRLENFKSILQRLIDISIKELQCEKLSDEDYKFIRYFNNRIESTLEEVNDKTLKTTIIADVHTDSNTRQVLEEV